MSWPTLHLCCKQTLTDKEYQRLRDASVAIIREMGVECGGSNVQMAVNPADGEVSSAPRWQFLFSNTVAKLPLALAYTQCDTCVACSINLTFWPLLLPL